MTIIALYNLKGGVGKTAGCVNLAYLCAQQGHNTLLWDFDAQGAATFYFKQQPKLRGGFKKLLAGETDPLQHVQATEFKGLHLLPADFGNRHLDVLLEELKQSKKRFKNLLAQLEGHYDFLFIDCPPGIGALSEVIFAAADFVVMPTIPTTLSMRSFEMVQAFFTEHKFDHSKLIGYFSMVDIRKNLHNETLEAQYRNKQFLKNYIPYLSSIEKMGSHLAPVASFAPSSYAAQCFADVWKELKKKMNG
ncbi:MAG TPA: ParA family protein [Phnomibacter sp.]|nr:ParA family protein [Phnomibacter sp.]